MKNNIFYILNHQKKDTEFVFTLFSPEREYTQTSLVFLLNNLFNEHKKKVYTFLYTYDLAKIDYYIKNNTSEILLHKTKSFGRQNILYCLEITHILYPNKKILIKDLYNFFL